GRQADGRRDNDGHFLRSGRAGGALRRPSGRGTGAAIRRLRRREALPLEPLRQRRGLRGDHAGPQLGRRAQAMSLIAGSRLGPYEIVAPLGAGGMGEVYRGRDTRLDRTVAIKVLPESLAGDPQFRERFDREARTISRLTHPNICTLYDVGEQAGVAFLVMELLDGETLENRC